MFKKLIAGALGMVALFTVTGVAFASSIDVTQNPHRYYHHCEYYGFGDCYHDIETTYIGMEMNRVLCYLYTPHKDYQNSYKYISTTTYGYDSKNDNYYQIKTQNKFGTGTRLTSPIALIDSNIKKIVYNGQIYNGVAKSSGILKKYLITPIYDGCPLK